MPLRWTCEPAYCVERRSNVGVPVSPLGTRRPLKRGRGSVLPVCRVNVPDCESLSPAEVDLFYPAFASFFIFILFFLDHVGIRVIQVSLYAAPRHPPLTARCKSAWPLTPSSVHKDDLTPHLVSAATHSRIQRCAGVNVGCRKGPLSASKVDPRPARKPRMSCGAYDVWGGVSLVRR